MKPGDYLWLAALALGAAAIWLHDLAWTASASETLPVLVALPLFIWVGSPWRWQIDRRPADARLLTLGGVLLALGCLLDLTILLAVAWTLAFWNWLRAGVVSTRTGLGQLMLLPAMGFPWLALDFAPLSWWFRLSAAWATDHLFGWAGFAVLRHGTQLTVQGVPIEIAAACSGTNTLQAFLIAGVVLLWLEFRGRRAFWFALTLLPVFAWIVNLLRICLVVVTALSWGADFARGWFHDVGGWLVLVISFLLGRSILTASQRWLVARAKARKPA